MRFYADFSELSTQVGMGLQGAAKHAGCFISQVEFIEHRTVSQEDFDANVVSNSKPFNISISK